jgi:hypothetical protein
MHVHRRGKNKTKRCMRRKYGENMGKYFEGED